LTSLKVSDDGSFEILERVEGGNHQVSTLSKLPAVFGWATGDLAEPPNNPQVGMANMRTVMPALAQAAPGKLGLDSTQYVGVALPAERRETRVVKDEPVESVAEEIVQWITGN